MFIRKATDEDFSSILQIYKEGYVNATRAGVHIWEKPSEKYVNDLLPNLYVVEMVKAGKTEPATVLHLTQKPNTLVWDSQEEEDGVFYLSKLAASSNALGYIGVSRVLQLIFLEIGECGTLRWDVQSENRNTVSFYESLGATKVAEHTFFSEQRQSDVSVVKFELQGCQLTSNI